MTLPQSTAVHKGSPTVTMGVPTVDDMGRRIDVDQLVGAAEIAERCGAARPQVVHEWRRRYDDFPEPVAQLKQALVWNWPEVERWAKNTGRL